MAGKTEPEAVYAIRELEQVRAIADPLRMRILEVLAAEEHTTKQVADKLGEKPTRLYHHVDALEKVGLIRLTRTRPNRGTLEKYYRAVARTFRVDSSVLPQPEIPQMFTGLLDRVAGELGDLLQADADGEALDEGVISFVQLDADEATIARYRRRLERLLKDLQKEEPPSWGKAGEKSGAPEQRRYRLLIAYYPLAGSSDGPD